MKYLYLFKFTRHIQHKIPWFLQLHENFRDLDILDIQNFTGCPKNNFSFSTCYKEAIFILMVSYLNDFTLCYCQMSLHWEN